MTDAERITSAKKEYTAQLKQTGNVSFTIWLLNRAEAAEARATQLENDLETEVIQHQESISAYKRLEAERDEYKNNIVEDANTIIELRRQLEQVTQERDNLRMPIIEDVST